MGKTIEQITTEITERVREPGDSVTFRLGDDEFFVRMRDDGKIEGEQVAEWGMMSLITSKSPARVAKSISWGRTR